MKRIFTVIFLVSVSSLTRSQNVGVDVSTPVQKLDVAGGLRLGTTTNGVAGSLRWNGSNFQVHDGTQWITFGTGSDLYWTLNGTHISPSALVTGNVGIGTSTPATKLQVVGTARVSALNVNGNYTLPITDGSAGFVLTTNGAGVVSWSDPSLVGDITAVTAGAGLVGGGTSGAVTLDVNAGDGIEIVSDQVRVKASDLDNASNGLTSTGNDFAVNVDNSTLDLNGDVLRVKPDGIGAAQIATGGVGSSEIADGSIASVDIATGGVTSTNILNGTILPADIASPGNSQILTTSGTGTVQWVTQGSLFGAQAGDGLVFDGTEVDVNPGDGITVASDQVSVNAAALEGNGLSVASNNFNVNVDDATIEINADALRVKSSGIQSSHIANGTIVSADIATGGVTSTNIADGTIVTTDIASPGNNQVLTTSGTGTVQWSTISSFTTALGGDGLVYDGVNAELDVNPGDGIEIVSDQVRVKASDLDNLNNGLTVTSNDFAVNADNSTLEVNADVLRVKASGIQSSHILDNTITAADIATGGVATAEILNGTILPADISSPGSPNLVLSTNGSNVVGWNNPASLTTVLQDGDADTKITVDVAAADEDHIRMSTFGTERLTIDNAGEIGIGTNTPDRDLHVVNATGGQILVSRGDVGTTVNETLGEIQFDSEDDSDPSTVDASAVIRGIAAESHGNSNKGAHMAFLTKPIGGGTGNTAAPERMRITSQGNVGIGTTSPVQKLEVAGAIRTVNSGEIVDINTDSNNPAIELRDNDGTGLTPFIDFSNDGVIDYDARIRLTGDDYLAIESANVGIGVTAPAQALHVAGTGRFSSLATAGSNLVYADANGDLFVSTSSINVNSLIDGSGTANYLARWTPDGNTLGTGTTYDNGTNVGMGTTSPSFKLHVVGDIHPDGKIVVQNSVDGGGSRGIWMWNAGDPNWGIYMGQSGASKSLAGGTAVAGAGFSQHAIRFRVANSSTQGFVFENAAESNLFSIRGSDGLGYIAGSMGIGTTAPAEKLHVNGSLRVEDGEINSGTDHISVMQGVRADDTSYEWVGFYSGSTRQGIILYDGAWTGANNVTNEFSITAENSNLLTLNTSGNHIALMPDGSGNVGVGTLSPSQKLDVAGAIRSTDYHYINHSSPTIVFQDSDQRNGAIHVNSNLMYFLSGSGTNGTSWSQNGSYWGLTLNMTNDEATFGGPIQMREGDLTVNDYNIWDVNSLTVNTIYDGEDSRLDIQDYVWFDNPAGTQDIWIDSYVNEPHIRPGSAGWGYLGRVQNWWRNVYSTAFNTMSQRSLKRNINPLDENSAVQQLIISDIDRLRPSLYKYNSETDDLESGNETSYRAQFHLGFILDETPDYIQDNEFGGVDNYALASMSIVGVKQNREDIKALREGKGFNKINDFGSDVITGESLWIDFDPEFAAQLKNGEIPVVNITAHELGTEVALVEKTSKGFRVKRSGTGPLGIDWSANAKVSTDQSGSKGENQASGSIPQEILNQLVVPQDAKQKALQISEQDKQVHERLGVK